MRSKVDFYRSVGSMLFEFARIPADNARQAARDKIKKAGKTISAATKAYDTAKSDVGSKKKGSPSRKRAAKYLKDALNARRTVNKNVSRAVEPKTEET